MDGKLRTRNDGPLEVAVVAVERTVIQFCTLAVTHVSSGDSAEMSFLGSAGLPFQCKTNEIARPHAALIIFIHHHNVLTKIRKIFLFIFNVGRGEV